MPQIDFYHLKDDGLALAVAMLADKSVASGQKFLVHCPASLTDVISEYLWTAKADNFLAHGVDDEEVVVDKETGDVWSLKMDGSDSEELEKWNTDEYGDVSYMWDYR